MTDILNTESWKESEKEKGKKNCPEKVKKNA